MSSFQGYRGSDDSIEILSWQDWKRIITAGGEVWSEYGYKLDTLEFIREVEETPIPARRRQWEWMRDHEGARLYDHNWLDSDQFSFTDKEFF